MTPHSHLLNLCSLVDPKNRNRSGIPYNVYVALHHHLRCGETFKATLPFLVEKTLALLSMLLFGRIDTSRAPLRRYARALQAFFKTDHALSSHTLHIGTLGFPFPVRPREQAHYILCDSTWDLWSRYATEDQSYSDRIHGMYDKLDKAAYNQADHIFSVSGYVKENLISHYEVHPDKITVVGTGLGGIKPFFGIKDYSARKILFVAPDRFVENGGLLSIEAFMEAVQVDPSIELSLVGNDELVMHADHPNITVHGSVGIDRLQELFNTHTVFLMPAFNEPWGLTYLEAMACKMPIIGLNRNSFPELSGYGKYGFMIDEPNPKLLGTKLLEAFQSPSSLQLMGENAHTYCLEQYSWDKTVTRMFNVLNPELSYA